MKTLSVPALQQSVCWELHRLVNCFPSMLFMTTFFQISLVSLFRLSHCQINQRYVMGTEICFPSPNPEYFQNCRLKKKKEKKKSFSCQNTPNPVPHTVKISKSDAFHHAAVWECFSLRPYSVEISQKYLAAPSVGPDWSISVALSAHARLLPSWLSGCREQKAARAASWWQQCCSQAVEHALLQGALYDPGEW